MSPQPTPNATTASLAGAGSGRFSNPQGAHGLMRAPSSPTLLRNAAPDS
jgi:hypothetical protein